MFKITRTRERSENHFSYKPGSYGGGYGNVDYVQQEPQWSENVQTSLVGQEKQMGQHHMLHDKGDGGQADKQVVQHTDCGEHVGVEWDGHCDEHQDAGYGDGYGMDGGGYGGKHEGGDVD